MNKPKCIVIGVVPIHGKKKVIEFLYHLSGPVNVRDISVETTAFEPIDFEYIELICKEYTVSFDLIFAYNDPKSRGDGVLFLGHWNDGIV